MSCKRKIQAWKEVSVKVDTLNQENIAQIENSVKECILQKLSKLDTILKNVNTYYYHGNIFINDRYGVLRDLEQIITAFGMNIKKIDCSLKGKNYIVSDELFEIARLLKIDDILNKNQVTEDILTIISNNLVASKFENLAPILEAIKKNGSYEIIQKELVEEIWQDGRLLNAQTIKKYSIETELKDTLTKFSNKVQSLVNSSNKFMQEGTTELLCSRAKQMGYSVRKERNGEEVQLVLVRVG